MLASQFYHRRTFLKKGLKQGLHPGVTITVGMYTDRLLHVKSLISFFYIHKFLIPHRERASLRASERYRIKSEGINTISGSYHVIICLLHITCLKNQATELKYTEKALIKLQSNSSRQILTVGVS